MSPERSVKGRSERTALKSLATLGISPAGSDARKAAQVQILSPRPLLCVEVPRYARDFACGLRRPQSGSSSNPSEGIGFGDADGFEYRGHF
jgi:hypothetical protein